MTSSIKRLLSERAALAGDSVAILAPECQPLSYLALVRQVDLCATWLHNNGCTAQTRVAVVLPNGPQMATVALSVMANAICAPLNPAYGENEFEFYLRDAGATVVVMRADEQGPIRTTARRLGLTILDLVDGQDRVAGEFVIRSSPRPASGPAAAANEASIPDAGVALILHTSGTTARPKIVPLSQDNLVYSARNIAAHLQLTTGDRCLNVMPLFHIHGLVGALLASIAGGASIVCTPGYADDAFFEWVAQFQPTWFTAVPTIHQSILANGQRYRQLAPTHQFRLARSSSAALPPSTLAGLQALLGAPVIEAYGMTEASHQMASNPLPPGQARPGSVGMAAGAQISIVDETGRHLDAGQIGEIVIRGPGVTAGYESNPQANEKSFRDGWFSTGDQGRLDHDGYLFITGRLKEIVNRGGEKISPREIDEALLEHPAVAQAVAFAVPHPTLGEDLAAAVVRAAGATASEPELRAYLLGRLADFKVPSTIVFVGSIPKGATGKVQRTSLYEKLRTAFEQEYLAPRSPVEQALADAICQVLGLARIGINDNFFHVGGDSLRGAQVMARVNASFGLDLPVAVLFKHPTIGTLAPSIAAGAADAAVRADDIAAEIDEMTDEEIAIALAAESRAQ